MTVLAVLGFVLMAAVGLAVIGFAWAHDIPEEEGQVSEGTRRRLQ